MIQTDWFPESEHGALYNMVGEGYEVDVDQQVVSGPLVAGGQDTGVDIEVRTGGPAIGDQTTAAVSLRRREHHTSSTQTPRGRCCSTTTPR